MNFCPMCGIRVIPNAKFCGECGYSFAAYLNSGDSTNKTDAPSEKNMEKPVEKIPNEMPKIPAKTAASIPTPIITEEGTTFSILGKTHTYSPASTKFMNVFKQFSENADDLRTEFESECNKRVHNFDELYTEGLQIFFNQNTKALKLSTKVINSVRKTGMDWRGFYDLCERDGIIHIDEDWVLLKAAYDKVESIANDIAAQRNIERGNRSTWVGDGYGITGAITGALKAGVLNIATDAVRGIGDAFTDADDRRKIDMVKQEIFKGKMFNGLNPIDYLANCVENTALKMFDEAADILELYYDEDNVDVSEVLEKVERYRPVTEGELIAAIFADPFKIKLYYPLYKMNENAYVELAALADAVGSKKYFDHDILKELAKKVKQNIPGKKDTLSSVQNKLERLQELADEYGFLPQNDVMFFIDTAKKALHDKKEELNAVKRSKEALDNKLSQIKELKEKNWQYKTKMDRFYKDNNFNALFNEASKNESAYPAYLLRRHYYDYATKYGVPQQIKELAASGNNMGANFLAAYLEAVSPRGNAERCHNAIFRMAKQGNIAAYTTTAILKDDYEGEKYDKKSLFIAAANAFDPIAMAYVGSFYRTGEYNTERNIDISRGWLKLALDCTPNLEIAKRELQKLNNGDFEPTKKDGCFITTAVCKSLGRADDCYELTMFRQFRDKYLLHKAGGKEQIAEYYTLAPAIVSGINRLPDAPKIYLSIWELYLKPCLELIETKKFDACRAMYENMVLKLKHYAERK